LITLAESEYDTGDWTSARQELADAVALNPESYLAHYLLGNALLKVGDAVAAISEYRSAIALAPEKPRTYVQLAQAMTANNDEAGAEDALKQALVSDSHYAPAHYELGRRLVEQQRFSEAVPYLNAAIKDNPAFETPYYLLAGAYDRMGRKEESRAMRKQFLAVKGANMKRAHSGAGATGLESETKSVR
jgi:predicted Zn-dependent protease